MDRMVNFGISFSGRTEFNEDWRIGSIAVNLSGMEEEISVKLAESTEEKATQYPQFGIKLIAGGRQREVDRLTVPPEIAKTMELSLQFLPSKDPIAGDRPAVAFKISSIFKGGESYLIKILNESGRLTQTALKIDAMELDGQVRFARCYPDRMIIGSEGKTQLDEGQLAVYFVFEGIVFVLNGWFSRFAKENKLAPPKNISSYENVAREVLRQLIKNMEGEPYKRLLGLIREGNQCEDPSRVLALMGEIIIAQKEAMGAEGYSTFMQKTLEAFVGDRVLELEGKIKELSAEFAACCVR